MNARCGVLFVLVVAVLAFSQAESGYRMEIDLSQGEWRLEIGDNPAYAQPRFNDDSWERVHVPSAWENQGFPGYDGFAWYRRVFVIPERLKGRSLLLRLGRIDDVDEVFLNGKLVGGSGRFPPHFRTAWDQKRQYEIASDLIKVGKENTLAIRVYDAGQGGGIYAGPVGFFSRTDAVELDIDLSGQWRFTTGDNPAWASIEHNDLSWKTLEVPGFWERQGFGGYDGIGWYRRSIKVPKLLTRSKLILLMGRIDDADEVYFNGSLIGHTGEISPDGRKPFQRTSYKELRSYFIPPTLIRPGRENVIAVRVCDFGGGGGIYQGPVGITTREEFMRFMGNQ